MCGIVGFLSKSAGLASDELEARVETMARRMVHRGPDSAGTWTSSRDGLAFGHRRLSIRDLSDLGSQPMISGNERWVLIYNGELYGLGPLRKELENAGSRLRSQGDTEILLESIAGKGLEKTLTSINGMFAFAAWDRETRTLFLARDRMGIKPLYWSLQGGNFCFASELKALHEFPGWTPQVDPRALSAYFQHGYIPAPLSIFRNTFKLEPGTWLTINADLAPKTRTYWSLLDVARNGMERPLTSSPQEAEEELHSLLLDSVKSRMVSDVPLGSFLSGGIDSSLVTALMQAQSSTPVHTFSLGFDVEAFDESDHAAAVAGHLGTKHLRLKVGGEDVLDTISELPEHHDEPMADMSQIPTYHVSKLARPHVTVALTGDGGDEVFCGYDRFRKIETMRKLQRIAGRRGTAIARKFLRSFGATRIPDMLNRIPGPARSRLHRERWESVFQAFDADSDMQAYRRFFCYWHQPGDVLENPADFQLIPPYWEEIGSEKQTLAKLQFVDQHTYLPDDLLTKVDRASMQVSLETRVPLLDHRVVEFAAGFPNEFRWNGSGSKALLRRILYRYVPRKLVDLPKMGFSIPSAEWLRGPLRGWADDLLSPQSLQRTGGWNVNVIRERWRQHGKGSHRWHYQLWPVLFYQAWARHWNVRL